MLEMLTYCVYAPLSARTPELNWLHRYTPFIPCFVFSSKMLIAFSPEISKIFGLLI
ncbi:hypothetical protein G0R26_004456 [Salmonella enterica]|uniref:Uncharacterized protein n=7 Tax=Salmonella enterica TaxID=28901 RepID=A0A735W1S2_SALNE|nr:hypothetical protein [Salmonella enterica subsp. enterica serovar Typhi]EDN4327633.1 hypothetical protein [Salmonella enterica subsp. enterica]EDN4761358.1 hypothetical protein [Salmonella enterica subsp. enterica serovar Saintpaul]EDN6510267.1 hypothetical protein [Salmonella enterica]EDQ1647738.1 hypothetical protein [Salmonella enterica subsp. enterica serovar Newport]EDQ4344655.1 hypothetical protein [Salmonella enterica subsp. enterica serovar Anecho]EDQ6780028.1 hypothetical protein 